MNETTFLVVDVDDLSLAFGGDMKVLLPPYESIPDTFKRFQRNNKWIKFQSDWFFSGIRNLQIVPKQGIDKKKAMRHLSAIQSSWEPSAEHKEAGVAYLASLWFEDVSYVVVDKKEDVSYVVGKN